MFYVSRVSLLGLVLSIALLTFTPAMAAPTSFFNLEAPGSDGKPVKLSTYQGQVVLVVNVASKCGFTGQYEGLEKLYRELKDQGLVILAFPSNEFGGQEPGTQQEILTFCQTKYNVTFPLLAKTMVKKGAEQSPVYQFLTTSHSAPKWNFYKYLINRQGQVVGEFSSIVNPQSPKLRAAITAALK